MKGLKKSAYHRSEMMKKTDKKVGMSKMKALKNCSK